jgi:DNA mismatch endonuclease (patch repair protein)
LWCYLCMQQAKNKGKAAIDSERVKALRSFNMSRIRSKNTRAEILLRRAMWAENLRFRIHADQLPGKPDILISRYRLVVFIDGAFWHGYDWDKSRNNIKSNFEFWITKIEANMRRDLQVNKLLAERGFTVMRFWDHQVLKELPRCINQIKLYIESCRIGTIPSKE